MNNIASPIKRVIAIAIDSAMNIMVILSVLVWFAASTDVNMVLDRALIVLGVFFLAWSVVCTAINVFLIARTGGTIGKLLTGIEIESSRGKRITYTRAFLRNVIGYMISKIYFLGFIWIFIDKQRRGWHDQIADTYVVTRRRFGWIFGLIALAFFITVNFFLLGTLITNFSLHGSIYKELVSIISNK